MRELAVGVGRSPFTLALMNMDYGHYLEGTVPQWLFDRATREISDYSVSLSIDSGPSGSGTLVSFGRQFGILTAAHVLGHVEKSRDSHFAVVFAPHVHRLLLDKQYIGTVRLDGASDESKGPDLALIIINDPGCISTLKAKKSFYPLCRCNPKWFVQYPHKEITLCFVFGAPAEFAAKHAERGTAAHVLSSVHFAARAQVTGAFSSGGYDCLEFAVCAGEHGFPANYGGVSGGGVWHVPVAIDPDKGIASISYQHVELIGVAFYQRPSRSGQILTAQSFASFPALLSKCK